ncbi:RagB/SusD family nutrient uptake outer membrane protein [Bacteroides faecichinchillae]|uniref:RagB/SusD family nutrient uptake outer membrane protein n=1 Tax=Bacteroides faecichinchillae TaxID=871325 RepID=UPI000687BD37|nr:RagB/SusD family nutrient uptake outer membrane protein [Bacteroides faecichinchillae]
MKIIYSSHIGKFLDIMKVSSVCIWTLIAFSCDFLDVVPDNVQTIEHAFSNSTEAEKYLFSCYSKLPSNASENGNVGFWGADEAWLPEDLDERVVNKDAWSIAKGYQNINRPYHSAWNSDRSANGYFIGLRLCNTFLENIQNESIVRDLELDRRSRWIGEALFLKAYYHYLLLRMYGLSPL